MSHLPTAKPQEIGIDQLRLSRVYQLLTDWTNGPNAPVPGAAILVGRNGKAVEPKLFGRQGPNPDAETIRPDSMFLLASITKPINYLAGMILVERGLLNLSDRVTDYLPDFAAHHKEETIVQHLFTHTSGLPDMLPNNIELRRAQAPLQKFIDGAIRDTVPLFPPGTSYSYQSMGTLVVAAIIQKISGKTIREFIRDEVFVPLGLQSSGLGAIGFDRQRLVRVQVPPTYEPSFGWNSPYWQDLGVPWGGMFSSPQDFAVLCQLMLNGGTYQGTRILSPTTVRLMTTNRMDDYPDLPEQIRRTKPWGLGWKLNQPAADDHLCDLLGQQAYGHLGATGTLFWVDPATNGFCLIFTSAERARAPWRLIRLSNALAASFV